MKNLFALSTALLSMSLLAACSGTASVIETPAPAPDAMNESRVADMEVSDTGFMPPTLIVRQGENVVLRIKSTQGTHSFTSADLGLDVTIAEGETKGFNIPTENPGSFEFYSVENPEGLKGMIVVQ